MLHHDNVISFWGVMATFCLQVKYLELICLGDLQFKGEDEIQLG